MPASDDENLIADIFRKRILHLKKENRYVKIIVSQHDVC